MSHDKNLFEYDEINKKFAPLKDEELEPKDLEHIPEKVWSIQKIWNKSNEIEKTPYSKVRDYVSFGDLGKTDMWSRYQKMMGVVPSNPPDERVLRIFSTGDVFHDVLKNIFKKAGIFLNSQDDVDEFGNNQWSVIESTDKTLKVLGKYDVLAGGKPDIEKARKYIRESDMSEFFKDRALKIAEHFSKEYPNGLEEMIYDFKSINSMAFWGKRNYLLEAYPHHVMQLYGYLKANNVKQGRLLYISKDDLVLAEFAIVHPTERYEMIYQRNLEEITKYIRGKIEPPKPEYVTFNKRKTLSFQKNKIRYKIRGSYDINWEVGYSGYLTLMTGFKTRDQFMFMMKPKIKEKNDKIKEAFIKKHNLNNMRNVVSVSAVDKKK